MVDYFDAPAGTTADAAANVVSNGNVQAAPATGGDTGMDDEIMVRLITGFERGDLC